MPPNPLRAIPSCEGSKLLVSPRSIRVGRDWMPVDGKSLLRVDGHLLGVYAGDRLRVYAQLTAPSPACNPGEFDYLKHARSERRLAELKAGYPECVQIVERASRWRIQRVLDALRQAGNRLLFAHVGEERSRLAAAMLLGDREGLPSTAKESYLMTGTIHLLVVSGLHIGVLAMGLFFVQRSGLLSRGLALSGVIALVVVYALIVDARPSVVRAAVLSSLLCVAIWNGRRVVRHNSLAAAALIVLAINPCDLFRVGPQLSFLSVGTLIWYSHQVTSNRCTDPLDWLIKKTRPWPMRFLTFAKQWVAHLTLATLAVWLTALPLVLHQFHIATPVAVVISPLVWTLTWFAIMSGFLLLLAGWLVPGLDVACGFVCNQSLAGLEWVVHASENVPGGHSWWPGPAQWWIVGFYVTLIIGVLVPRLVPKRRWRIALLAGWITVGLAPSVWKSTHHDSLECSFVAMGHGTCVVLETPGGKTLLYDAGSLGSPNHGARTIAAYLWSRGITRIDGIVLSHADVDHYNAVPGLLQRFDVGDVYVSPLMFEPLIKTGSMNAPNHLRDILRAAAVPIREIFAGDQLDMHEEGLRIEVLHPQQHGVLGSDNANSIVLLVEFRGRRILLPGDLESPGLDDLLAEMPIDCDIVLAPHHGSNRSDPPGFARWCSPEWAVISGGSTRKSAEAEAAYRRAGTEVQNTAKVGAVRFSVGKQDLRCEVWDER